MNKEQLVEKVIALPTFEKRAIKVAMPSGSEKEWHDEPEQKAICDVSNAKPLAFVGNRYNLLQFKDSFLPILDSIEGDVEGYVQTFGGFAQLILYPEEEDLKTENGRLGIVAMNSVDCSSAVIVKFCVEHGHRRITIPPKVAGLKKAHTGRVGNLVKDYMAMVGPVKELWGRIVTEFPKYSVVIKESEPEYDDYGEEIEGKRELVLKDVSKKLKLGKRLTDKIQKRVEDYELRNMPYTLWNVFVDSVDKLSEKKYKSDVHASKRIDKLSDAVIQYAMVLSI